MKILFSLFYLLSFACYAESKNQYTFLNPTPKHQLRSFETERPDRTRSPYTVDAGHVVVESEITSYFENEEKDERGLRLFQTNVRTGITNNSEIQFQLEPYIHKVENYNHRKEKTRDGIGNTTLRYKYNMQGNDSGQFAAAIMPFVIFPTSSASIKDEKIEHGVSLPIDLRINSDWKTSFMLQLDTETTRDDVDWQSNLGTSWSVSHIFSYDLVAYLEVYNQFQRRKKTTNVTTLDLALQYQLNSRMKLDIGTFIGLSPEAEDLENFMGVSLFF